MIRFEGEHAFRFVWKRVIRFEGKHAFRRHSAKRITANQYQLETDRGYQQEDDLYQINCETPPVLQLTDYQPWLVSNKLGCRGNKETTPKPSLVAAN